jgi:outer membrane biosynthesis protein TonB
MSDNLEHLARAPQITDRRRHPRIQVPFVLYVELGNGNGGLIPNISESGFAVQAGTILVGDDFSSLQFQLPESGTWIECHGRLAWRGASKKEAGIEFIDLHKEGRDQIRDWISSQAVSGAVPAGKSNFNGVVETEDPDGSAGIVDSDYTVEQTSPAEFDASEFFPEERKLSPRPAACPDAFEARNRELKPDSAPFAGANDSASSAESGSYEQPFGVYPQSTDRAGSFPSELPHEEPMPAGAMNQDPVGHGDQDSGANVSISDIRVAGRSPRREIQHDVLSYAHAAKAYPDDFTPHENRSWRPLILTGVIAFVGGLAFAAFLICGPLNIKALVSHGPTTTTDPFQGDAPTADVLSLPPAALPPSASDSDKQRNMHGSSRSPGLPPLPPVVDIVTATERPKDVSQSASSTVDDQSRTNKSRTGAAQSGLADAGTPDRQNPAATRAEPFASRSPSDEDAHGNQNTQDDLQANKKDPTRSPGIASQQAEVSQTAAVARNETSPVAPSVDENARIASGSVAINTRLFSLRVPRGPTTQTSQLGATLEIGQLISSPQPVYPPEAARQRIEGTVTLHAVVGGDGRVKSVEPVSGPSVLLAPAMSAVRDWRYGQTLIDGKPIESVRNIDLVFRLLN